MLRFEKFKIIYEEILHQPLSEARMKELGEEFSKFVYKEVLECPFVKGAYEFLDKYYQKIPFFIVSGTPHEEIRLIIKERGLSKYFKRVYGAPPGKGTLILKIIKDYNFTPKDIFFVGDSIDDYEGAKEAGVKFVGRVAQGKENIFAKFNISPIVEDMFALERIIDGQKI
jgi:HAD superfamily hydrolase (TIGR01549 family)